MGWGMLMILLYISTPVQIYGWHFVLMWEVEGVFMVSFSWTLARLFGSGFGGLLVLGLYHLWYWMKWHCPRGTQCAIWVFSRLTTPILHSFVLCITSAPSWNAKLYLVPHTLTHTPRIDYWNMLYRGLPLKSIQ